MEPIKFVSQGCSFKTVYILGTNDYSSCIKQTNHSTTQTCRQNFQPSWWRPVKTSCQISLWSLQNLSHNSSVRLGLMHLRCSSAIHLAAPADFLTFSSVLITHDQVDHTRRFGCDLYSKEIIRPECPQTCVRAGGDVSAWSIIRGAFTWQGSSHSPIWEM